MTIMQLDGEIESVIDKYHVYGAEWILHSLVRACSGQPYLEGDDIQRILKEVINHEAFKKTITNN